MLSKRVTQFFFLHTVRTHFKLKRIIVDIFWTVNDYGLGSWEILISYPPAQIKCPTKKICLENHKTLKLSLPKNHFYLLFNPLTAAITQIQTFYK